VLRNRAPLVAIYELARRNEARGALAIRPAGKLLQMLSDRRAVSQIDRAPGFPLGSRRTMA